MRSRKQIEGDINRGDVVTVTSRKVRNGKIESFTRKVVVLDVVEKTEHLRDADFDVFGFPQRKEVVVKSDCIIGEIDGNLPVEMAHHCLSLTPEIKKAWDDNGGWHAEDVKAA